MLSANFNINYLFLSFGLVENHLILKTYRTSLYKMKAYNLDTIPIRSQLIRLPGGLLIVSLPQVVSFVFSKYYTLVSINATHNILAMQKKLNLRTEKAKLIALLSTPVRGSDESSLAKIIKVRNDGVTPYFMETVF